MAFADSGWLEIRPITLLFGQNSTGKSTIIKALMFLKQSADASKLTYFSEHGIDLDTYENILHGVNKSAYKKSKKKLSFGFKFSLDDELFSDAGISSGQTITFDFDLAWNPKRNVAEVVAFEIILIPNDILLDDLYFRIEIEDYQENESNPNLIYSTNFFDASTNIKSTGVWQEVSLKTAYGFIPALEIKRVIDPNEKNRDWDFVNGILARLSKDILDFLKSLISINPIRPASERLFIINESRREEFSRHGFTSFLNFLNCDFANETQQSELNQWAKKLALGQEIRPQKYENVPGASIISQILVTNLSGKTSNLVDLGFGLSQVLPILIESLFGQAHTTIMIQQPELHLHPSAQAELGDLFITLVNTKNKIYILETHSEHLILRILRRIKETVTKSSYLQGPPFAAESLSVIITTRDYEKNTSEATAVKFNSEGDMITPWPGGFFEEGFRERFLIG